jgi:hypothetical protein
MNQLQLAVLLFTVMTPAPTSGHDHDEFGWVKMCEQCSALPETYATEILAGPHENPGQTEISEWFNGSSTTQQHVRGNTQTTPPWTSPFATLSEDWWPHSVAAWKTIPPGKKKTTKLSYNHTAGHEQWMETLAETTPADTTMRDLFYQRLRRWDTNPVVYDVTEDL